MLKSYFLISKNPAVSFSIPNNRGLIDSIFNK